MLESETDKLSSLFRTELIFELGVVVLERWFNVSTVSFLRST